MLTFIKTWNDNLLNLAHIKLITFSRVKGEGATAIDVDDCRHELGGVDEDCEVDPLCETAGAAS